MKKWTKSMFQIKGYFTGSRLAGRENEYLYKITYNGQDFGDMRFTSEAKASKWLGEWLKKANDIRRKVEGK